MISEEHLLKTLSKEITFSNNEDYNLESNYRFDNEDFDNYIEFPDNLINLPCLDSDVDDDNPSFLLKKRRSNEDQFTGKQSNCLSFEFDCRKNISLLSSTIVMEDESKLNKRKQCSFNSNTSNSIGYFDSFKEYDYLKARDTNYHSSTSLPFITDWNDNYDYKRALPNLNSNYLGFDFINNQSGIENFKNISDFENDLCLNNDSFLDLDYKISNFSLSKNKNNANPVNSIIKYLNGTIKNEENKEKLVINNTSTPELMKNNNTRHIFTSRKISNSNVIITKPSKKSCCSCKKSHCLKLYCECFKKAGYCESCSCPNCLNNDKYEEIRQKSINHLKSKNKNAFKSVVIEENNSNSSTYHKKRHIKGCKCINSSCKKNYCECYQYGLSCTEKCKCVNCKNGTCEEIVLDK